MGIDYHYVDGAGQDVQLDESLNPVKLMPDPEGGEPLKALRQGDFFGVVLQGATLVAYRKMTVGQGGTVSSRRIAETDLSRAIVSALRRRLTNAYFGTFIKF